MTDEKIYDYEIYLQTVDYNIQDGSTTTIEYVLPWEQESNVAPSTVVSSLEDGAVVAFMVTGRGEFEETETNPVFMKIAGMVIGNDDENKFRVAIQGEVIMIDGVATSPPSQSVTTYDDLVEIGFEVTHIQKVSETSENGIYDGILREISNYQD